MKNNENSHFLQISHELIDSGIWALLTKNERSYYVTIGRFADFSKHTCFPSIKTTSRLSGVHERTISQVTKSLAEMPLIEKKKRGYRIEYKIIQEIDINTILIYLKSRKNDKKVINRVREKETGKFAKREK